MLVFSVSVTFSPKNLRSAAATKSA